MTLSHVHSTRLGGEHGAGSSRPSGRGGKSSRRRKKRFGAQRHFNTGRPARPFFFTAAPGTRDNYYYLVITCMS